MPFSGEGENCGPFNSKGHSGYVCPTFSACNVGDLGSIPGLARSTGEGIGYPLQYSWASLVAQLVKNLPNNVGDLGSIPGLRRSPGDGKGCPLQHSGLEHSMDCIVHGVTKGRTQLSNFRFHFLPEILIPLLVSYGTCYTLVALPKEDPTAGEAPGLLGASGLSWAAVASGRPCQSKLAQDSLCQPLYQQLSTA